MEIRQPSITPTGPLIASSGPLGISGGSQAVADAPAVPAKPRSSASISVSTDLRDMMGAGNLEPLVSGNLQAIADLEGLQASGKITPEILAGLEQLATQPLAAGIDRGDLIATALRQLSDPSTVNQGDKFTCAPAVVQMMVAEENPSEYLRLISGLASPEGKVTLQNGATIARDANWQSDPTRSVIDNLMQPALMQYATGSYDSLTDARSTATGSGQGLYASEQDKLIAAVTGRDNTSILGSGPEVIGQLEKATAAGEPVPAIIKYKDENGQIKGHAVLVEIVKNGQVTYLDPKAGRKTVSLEEFQAKLQSVSLPTVFVTPTLAKSAMKADDGLLAGGFMRRLRRAFRRITNGISKVVKSVVNVVKKVVNVVKKALYQIADIIGPILPILSIVAWLIPGVGPAIAMALKIAQAVVAAANALRAAESGDFLGAIAAGAAAFSGVASGPAAGMAAKFASYANTAKQVVTAAKNGDFAGALGAIAGATGNQNLATAANVANAVQKKDVGAALGALGSATGNQTLNRAASLVNTAQQVKYAVDSKDFLGAALAVNGMAVDAKILDAGEGKDVQRWLERGQALDHARRTGDVGGVMDLAAQTAEELGVVSRKDYQKVLPQLKQGVELYQAAKRGDTEAALQLGAKALAGAGIIDQQTLDKAQSLVQQVAPLKQAIDAKDYANAAKLAARMGFDAGVAGLSDPAALKKVEDLAATASKLQEGLDAARRGDTGRAAKIADEVFTDGKIHRELEERQRAFEAKAKDLGKQISQSITGR